MQFLNMSTYAKRDINQRHFPCHWQSSQIPTKFPQVFSLVLTREKTSAAYLLTPISRSNFSRTFMSICMIFIPSCTSLWQNLPLAWGHLRKTGSFSATISISASGVALRSFYNFTEFFFKISTITISLIPL